MILGSRLTHCRRGHALTEGNVYKRPHSIECRQCRKLKYAERLRAARLTRGADRVGISFSGSLAEKVDWDVPSLMVEPKVLLDCILQNGARYRLYANPSQGRDR